MQELTNDILEKMKEEQDSNRKFWSKKELDTLQKLIDNGIKSPELIHKYGLLTNRSLNAISIKMSQMKRSKI